MRNKNPELNANFQYQEYLRRARITEAQMPDIQRIETKRAFFAGIGQTLILLRDQLSENDEEGSVELQNLHDQVLNFFRSEVGS